jgi:hypothetical protein
MCRAQRNHSTAQSLAMHPEIRVVRVVRGKILCLRRRAARTATEPTGRPDLHVLTFVVFVSFVVKFC